MHLVTMTVCVVAYTLALQILTFVDY